MKKILLLFSLLVLFSPLSAQRLQMKTLLKDKISIRAIQLWDGRVWYAGTDSKFGYVSLKDTLDKKQHKIYYKNLQFRTLGQNSKYFFAINIESPAHFFRIDKKSLSAVVIHKDTAKTAFYDALHFVNPRFALALSDPNGTCASVTYSKNGGQTWKKDPCSCYPSFAVGEAAFAASNSNITSKKGIIWFATGGGKSRIFKMNRHQWRAIELPFIQGSASQGIYSIDFYDKNFGIAVGGDYTAQDANINNIATTHDGGETWQIHASGQNGGYKTCVKIRPGSKGKEIIAVGDQNIEFSSDFGKTWKKLSDEKGLYTCEWVDKNTLVFAGKNRIVKMDFFSGK